MNNETSPESYPLESLTLLSGKSLEENILILVSGWRMAISTDFGPTDPWRNKEHVGLPYVYEPLNLSNYTNLEKVW